ncbi:MAG: Homoserine dehydrogenase [candidate division BRC1 bacterium ADurb.BinA364]|nr:MAG: Homoserine dehydrogenase [candidate division BRC1 bacterium ADurb.BinA364]
MSDPLKVGLIGFGNIGTGVMRLLAENGALIDSRLPRPIRIARIADLDTATRRDCPYDPAMLSADTDALLDDPSIEAVIELIGGYEPARTFVERALAAGKHVVTANKAMLAKYGADLMARAPSGAALLYEAAIGGGIPLIRTIHQGLAANEIRSIRGILNGTCNYILSSMDAEGVSFEHALGEAQRLGYAEPDPTFDISGTDTAHKTVLLASQCFGQDIRFDDAPIEGIQRLTPVDFAFARELNYKIKLLGIARRKNADSPVEIWIGPTLLTRDAMLAGVPGVFNAVEIAGEPIGPTLYYGQGAGPRATASAVVSDLMALASATAAGGLERESRLRIPVGVKNLKPRREMASEYYIRFLVTDKPGTMAKLGKALGDKNISIRSMIQHGKKREQNANVIIITHEAKAGDLADALDAIRALDVNKAEPAVLRVEDRA